jgi:hypothetical protein
LTFTLVRLRCRQALRVAVELLDGMGRVVRHATLLAGQTEFPLTDVPPGVYSVRLPGLNAPLRRLVIE